MAAPQRLIATGDTIILRGGDIQRLVALKPGLTIKLGRLGNVNVGSLVGQHFDSTYQVDESGGKKFQRVSDDMLPDLEAEMQADDVNSVPSNLQQSIGGAAAAESGAPATRDNRSLVDTNTAQSLTVDDLQELKDREGVAGVVGHLVQHSATFASKTAFAQEKYIKRKKIKYNNVFRVERPTVASLCEFWCPSVVRNYNDTEPTKFLRLRIDAVAQVLSLANVCHNSRVLMYEKTNGFMCGAALERMGDLGRVFHVLPPNAHANIKIAEVLGIPAVKERWRALHLEDLIPSVAEHLRKQAALQPQPPEGAAAAAATAGEDEDDDLEDEAADADGDDTAAAAAGGKKAGRSSRVRMELRKDEIDALLARHQAYFDTLIVVDDEDPSAIAAALFPFLRMSGQIVVYSPYSQQLYGIHSRLRDDVCGARIQETWLREIQVLPNRTHPHVNMSHTGGFIFCGTKVQPLSVVRPPGMSFRDLKNSAGKAAAAVGDGEDASAGQRRERPDQ